MRDRARLVLAAVLTLPLISYAPVSAQSQEPIYTSADGVVLPAVVKMVRPEYTRDAMQLGITGSVTLSSIVRTDGHVTDVEVVKSLDPDYGLDQAAVDALKQWEFKPGTKDGRAVSVRIECELKFTLK
jgi:TonB family protein